MHWVQRWEGGERNDKTEGYNQKQKGISNITIGREGERRIVKERKREKERRVVGKKVTEKKSEK